MSYATRVVDRAHALALGLLCCGSVAAQEQALCDVLLRPAFHYTTEGLVLIVADSSTTYGLSAGTTWSFGDGSSTSLTPQHVYGDPGHYEVCLTLTSPVIGCASTYCRDVLVPLNDCGGTVDAHFVWQRAGFNAAVITDASSVAFAGTRLWEFGDGSTSDETTPTHNWSLPGPHFVTLTRTQGECAATYGEWVEVDGNASTCGQDLFVDFTTNTVDQEAYFEPSVSGTNAVPFVSIWSYGDGTLDTTAFGSHAYTTFGIYQTCLLVGALGLQQMDTCFSLVCHTSELIPTAGLDDRAAYTLSTWPNPFDTQVNVSTVGFPGPLTTMLYDALGRIVLEQRSVAVEVVRINATDLREGAYVLEVISGNTRYRSPVIKAGK